MQISEGKRSPCLPPNSYIFIVIIIFFFLRYLLLIEVHHANQEARIKTQEDDDGWQCWVSNGC